MLVPGWCNQYHPAITTGIAAGPCDFSVETITEHHYRCSHTPCIECRRPKWRYDPTASKVRRIRDADRRGDRYTPAKRTEHDIVWKTQGHPDRSTTEYLHLCSSYKARQSRPRSLLNQFQHHDCRQN